eukprot:855173_1
MAERLFVILLVSVPVLEAYRLVLTRWFTYMYLVIHIWLLPFDSRKYAPEIGFDINHLETFSLGLLCLLVHLADYEQDDVLQVYNALKLAPAIMLVVLLCYRYGILKIPFFKQLLPEEAPNAFTDRSGAAFKSVDVDPTALNNNHEEEGCTNNNNNTLHVPVDQVMTIIDEDDDYEEELQKLSDIHVFKQTFRNKLEVGIKMLSLDKSKTKSKSVDGKVYQSFDEGDEIMSPQINSNDEGNDNPYVEMETPIPNEIDAANPPHPIATFHDAIELQTIMDQDLSPRSMNQMSEDDRDLSRVNSTKL